jgi:two-component system, NarL family, sensor histidine kinase LiaS
MASKEGRMDALARRFKTLLKTLRWRLMLACFVAALTAMMTLEGTFVIVPGVIAMVRPQQPAELVGGLQKLAPQLAPILRQMPPDRARLAAALSGFDQPIVISEGLTENFRGGVSVIPGKNAALMVIGSDGAPLVGLEPPSSAAGELTDIAHSSGARAVIAAALRNDTQTNDLIQDRPGEPTVAAAPIVASDGTVRGALLIGVDLAALLRPVFLLNLLGLLPSIIIFGFIASIFGAVFGVLTARGLTRRLDRLTAAADAWSQGDFTATARDPSPDELGRLARDLNRMAEQLQNLLRDRQQLAVVEERNRLARELHDSVKQQMFALTMLLGSAQLEVEEQSEARRILGDAERVARNAQQEMATLIQALRPVALANKGLGSALRELCGDWEIRTGVTCLVDVLDTLTLAPDVEQQLFRITQEALANSAKHSGATRVEVHAAAERGTLALRIRDNGRGFDVAQAEGRGLGLSSMRERVEEMGGMLTISSASGGTRLEIVVPLAQPARSASASET